MEVGEPRRGDVYLISLDPTRGSEIRKSATIRMRSQRQSG